MPTPSPSLIMKARVTLLDPCVHEGKHKVRLAVLSGNSSCFLLSSECERIFSSRSKEFAHWLVGCFGLNGPLRQYFSLYRAVSQREGERRERIDESKNVQTTPTRTYCKRNRPLPYCNQNCRTPREFAHLGAISSL